MSTVLTPLSSKTTGCGGLLNACLLYGLPFTPPANTTLNERFQIHQSTTVPAGAIPKIQYYAIGNRGRYNSLTADGIPITKDTPHSFIDFGLYGHTPFLLRTIGNDLTDIERQKYGMRVPVTHNGINYWAYYLRRFNNADLIPQPVLKKIVVTDPDTDPTVTDFVPTAANLTPTPPVIPNNGALISNGIYYSVSVPLSLTMDSNDISEFLAAVEIIHGTRDAGVITELAVVGAYRAQAPILDFNRAIVSGAGAGTYFEAYKAVVTNFIATSIDLNTVNSDWTLDIDAGITEPEFGIATTQVI